MKDETEVPGLKCEVSGIPDTPHLTPRPSLPNGQLVLIEAESDEALLMSAERRAKIFTAALAQKIADRMDCILALISCRLPLDEVARRAHISHHTVRELIGQHATLIAVDMDKYAGWTAGLSAKFLMLADLKSDTAQFKDLIAAHSFVGKLSLDMKLASQQLTAGLGDLNGAIDAEAESEQRVRFKERLKLLGKSEIRNPKSEMEVVPV